MKKSIIALAVAGAMTVPMVAQADATLFGSARFDIEDTDDTDGINSELDRVRIGVKGEETLDSGITAGYFFRFAASGGTSGAEGSALNADKVAVYLSGSYGKVVLGTADSPLEYIDGRQTYTAIHDGSLEFTGQELTSGAITYESPKFNGFQVIAGIGDVDADDADDSTNAAGVTTNSASVANEREVGIALQFDNDTFGVTAGVGTTSRHSGNVDGSTDNDNDVYGISGEYKFYNGKIGASYSEEDNYGEYYSVSAKYSIDKLTLAAQYEVADLDAERDEREAFNISAAYDLGGNASVALSYVDFNDDAEDATTDAKNDQLRLRYSLSF